jgi:hypothetical protein
MQPAYDPVQLFALSFGILGPRYYFRGMLAGGLVVKYSITNSLEGCSCRVHKSNQLWLNGCS